MFSLASVFIDDLNLLPAYLIFFFCRISKFKVTGNLCAAYEETLSLIVDAMISFFEVCYA